MQRQQRPPFGDVDEKANETPWPLIKQDGKQEKPMARYSLKVRLERLEPKHVTLERLVRESYVAAVVGLPTEDRAEQMRGRREARLSGTIA